MNRRVSENIYKVKFFAILSVICAHCSSVSANHSFMDNFVSYVLDSIGSVGVGIFLFISGYLFYDTRRTFKDFFTSKLKTIVIPWLFCGTAVYLYVKFRKGGLGITSWIKWISGVDTYLYYLTVLFMLYLLCYFIRKNKIAKYMIILFSVISNIFTSFGIFGVVSPYLNPFNFSFFFVLGLICSENNLIETVFDFSKKICVYTSLLYLIVVIILAYFDVCVTYFNYFYILIELLAIISAMGLSDLISVRRENAICDIGKLSFSIYLLHMPIAGIIANIFGRIDFFILTLIRPIIVLVITYMAIKLVLKVVQKTPFKSVVNILIGTR